MSPASYLTAPPRAVASSVPPGGRKRRAERRFGAGLAATIAGIETLFWIALAAAVIALVASTTVLVVRGIRLRRDVRALGGVLGEATVQLAVRTAAAEAALDRLEAQQQRVREAGDRLQRDLRPLAVLREEIDRFRTALEAVRSAVPSK
jgi:hypothetical protein